MSLLNGEWMEWIAHKLRCFEVRLVPRLCTSCDAIVTLLSGSSMSLQQYKRRQVVVVGDKGVGKSTLMYRLKWGGDEHIHTPPTLGFNIEYATVHGIDVQMSDLGGSCMCPLSWAPFFSKADAILLVVDTTSLTTSLTNGQAEMDKMVRLVRLQVQEVATRSTSGRDAIRYPTMVVVLNKTDLLAPEHVGVWLQAANAALRGLCEGASPTRACRPTVVACSAVAQAGMGDVAGALARALER